MPARPAPRLSPETQSLRSLPAGSAASPWAGSAPDPTRAGPRASRQESPTGRPQGRTTATKTRAQLGVHSGQAACAPAPRGSRRAHRCAHEGAGPARELAVTHTSVHTGGRWFTPECTPACTGASAQVWQAQPGFRTRGWRGTLAVSSASSSEHRLGWPSGVWGGRVVPAGVGLVCGRAGLSGCRAHMCTPTGMPAITHSQALPQLLRVIRRPQGPEALLQGSHCPEKGTCIRSRRNRPGDPQTPGCIPTPSRGRARSPRTGGPRPRRPRSEREHRARTECYSPVPAPHSASHTPVGSPRHSPLPALQVQPMVSELSETAPEGLTPGLEREKEGLSPLSWSALPC